MGDNVRYEMKPGLINTIGPRVTVGATNNGEQVIHIEPPQQDPVDTLFNLCLFFPPGPLLYEMSIETSPLAQRYVQDLHNWCGPEQWDGVCTAWNLGMIACLGCFLMVSAIVCVRRANRRRAKLKVNVDQKKNEKT